MFAKPSIWLQTPLKIRSLIIILVELSKKLLVEIPISISQHSYAAIFLLYYIVSNGNREECGTIRGFPQTIYIYVCHLGGVKLWI